MVKKSTETSLTSEKAGSFRWDVLSIRCSECHETERVGYDRRNPQAAFNRINSWSEKHKCKKSR